MPKQENTAINNRVNVTGGGRLESEPGDNLFGDDPVFRGLPAGHRAQLMDAQPAMTMRGAPPVAARAHAAQARRPHPTSHGHVVQAHVQRTMPAHVAQQGSAYGPPTMPAHSAPYPYGSPTVPARPAQADARARSQQAHAAHGRVAQPSRAYAAQPSRGHAAQPAMTSMESMQTIARDPYAAAAESRPTIARAPNTYASRDSLDGKPTISMLSQRQRTGASPYAPTEPVRDLAHAPTEPVRDLGGASRGYAHPAARVPQPNVPVAPLPRHRAPAATPSVFPASPDTPITARNVEVPALPSYTPAPNLGDPEELNATIPFERFVQQDPTALVHALPTPRPGHGRFLVELGRTLKQFAAPIGVLTVVAVFLGGYLAFDGQGGKKRPTAAMASAPVTVVSTPSRTALADAVIAADPSLGPGEHVTANVPAEAPTVTAAVTATVAAAELVAAPAAEVAVPDDDELEMEATKVDKKKRSARSRRSRATLEVALAEDEAASTRRTVEKTPVETRSEKAAAKRTAKVAEGELPPNVADKTNGGPGKLVVTADVPALIYLDGRNTNLTAPKKITVPAGKHKVTLLDPDTRKARTQDVEVVAGKTVTVEKQFN